MLDVKTSEVISYSLSDNLQMGFVLDTINSGIKKYPTGNGEKALTLKTL